MYRDIPPSNTTRTLCNYVPYIYYMCKRFLLSDKDTNVAMTLKAGGGEGRVKT